MTTKSEKELLKGIKYFVYICTTYKLVSNLKSSHLPTPTHIVDYRATPFAAKNAFPNF